MALSHRFIATCAVALLVTGCAQMVAPPYSADYTALDQLKKSAAGAKTSIGAFQPTDPKDAVNNLSLRAARLGSSSGSFAKYLEDALSNDLKEISVYDPAARTRIDAVILHNEMAIGGFNTGEGLMDVDLTITRDGVQRLRKTYLARTTFESSFAGAVAIPKAQSEYPRLVRELLRNVYSDPAFVSAITP